MKLAYLYIVTDKQKYRNVKFYKSYFQDFFAVQTKKVKTKIVWTLDLIRIFGKSSGNLSEAC